MARYSDIVRDQNNAPIPGVNIYVTLQDGQMPVLTDDDDNVIVQPIISDEYGAYYFNAADDFYDLDFYYISRRVQRNEGVPVGNPYAQFVGPTGPADNTYFTLSTFKAQPVTNGAARLVSAPGVTNGEFAWTLGDYTGQADDVNIIESDNEPLSVGAWVRQAAASIAYTPPPGAMLVDLQRRIDMADMLPAELFGARAGLLSDQAPAINAAIDKALELGNGVLLPQASTEDFDNTFIYIGSPITLKRYLVLKGHGINLTRLRLLPGYLGPMFELADGPVSYGGISDIGCYGNGVEGEDCFGLIAKPLPVAPFHGGLWSWTLARIRAENFGGVTLKLWAGVTGLLPHQFITLIDCSFYRPEVDGSRCISMAGQCGQIYAIGNNEFDGDINAVICPGSNIVVSRLFQTIADETPGDITDACNADGSLKAGWEVVPGATNNNSYTVYFTGTTTQWSERPIVVDACYGFVFDGYIEGAYQAVTVSFGSTAAIGLRRAGNAGGYPEEGEYPDYDGPYNDGQGYIVCNDNSHVSVLTGGDIGGRCDRSFIKRGGVTPSWDIGHVRMPGGIDSKTIPSDVTQPIAISSGVLNLSRATSILVSGGSPVNLNSIASELPPSSEVTLTCAFGNTIQFANGSEPAHASGAPVRLRFKDSVTIRLNDLGTQWTIVGRSISELAGTTAPASGYHWEGERSWNSAPVVGQPIYWVCTVSGDPGTWVAGPNL